MPLPLLLAGHRRDTTACWRQRDLCVASADSSPHKAASPSGTAVARAAIGYVRADSARTTLDILLRS